MVDTREQAKAKAAGVAGREQKESASDPIKD